MPSTVSVTIYKAGFLESFFNKLAEKFDNKVLHYSFSFMAMLCRVVRNFFSRLFNRIKAIGFTKKHFKAYFSLLFLNFAFFMQGLICLVTLGLIVPSFTSRPSIIYARASQDLRDLKTYKMIQEEEAEAAAAKEIYGADAETEKPKSKIPDFQRERAIRSNMTDEEIKAEIKEKLQKLREDNK